MLFDASALRDAINAVGRSVWGPDRPALWVQLPPQEQPVNDALRQRLSAAAQLRGLPIMFAVGAATDADALAAARRAGAGAALTTQSLPSDPASLQWTLVAPSGDGHWSGAPELAIDGATDALVQAARELGTTPVAQFNCHISGVSDLPSLANVLSALRAAPQVSEVVLREVDADSLMLSLKARASQQELEHALANDRLRVAGTGDHGALEYRYQPGP